MHRIGMLLHENLRTDEQLNVYLIPKISSGTDAEKLKLAVNLSNDFIRRNGGAGYHVALHSDAGGYATGCSVLFKSEDGQKIGIPIMAEMANLTPGKDVGLRRRDDLYELNKTLAVATLVEVSFHDEQKEARWIHDNLKPIADALYRGILKGVGL